MRETVRLDGLHALKHALRFGAEVVEVVSPDPARLDALAAELCPDVRERIAALVTVGEADHPTGVVATALRPLVGAAEALADRSAPVVLLEDPRRGNNIGAAVRVAAAAGAAGVLTTGYANPWNPVAVRAGTGLQFALPVAHIEELGALERPLVAFEVSGAPLTGPDATGLPDDAVLAFGTERDGLSDALLARADERVRIPMRPGVSSLNLATAVAVALYAPRRRS